MQGPEILISSQSPLTEATGQGKMSLVIMQRVQVGSGGMPNIRSNLRYLDFGFACFVHQITLPNVKLAYNLNSLTSRFLPKL